MKIKNRTQVMNKMQELMQAPNAMKQWMENKKKEFDGLSDDKK